jgi:hypothetical protein
VVLWAAYIHIPLTLSELGRRGRHQFCGFNMDRKLRNSAPKFQHHTVAAIWSSVPNQWCFEHSEKQKLQIDAASEFKFSGDHSVSISAVNQFQSDSCPTDGLSSCACPLGSEPATPLSAPAAIESQYLINFKF